MAQDTEKKLTFDKKELEAEVEGLQMMHQSALEDKNTLLRKQEKETESLRRSHRRIQAQLEQQSQREKLEASNEQFQQPPVPVTPADPPGKEEQAAMQNRIDELELAVVRAKDEAKQAQGKSHGEAEALRSECTRLIAELGAAEGNGKRFEHLYHEARKDSHTVKNLRCTIDSLRENDVERDIELDKLKRSLKAAQAERVASEGCADLASIEAGRLRAECGELVEALRLLEAKEEAKETQTATRESESTLMKSLVDSALHDLAASKTEVDHTLGLCPYIVIMSIYGNN